MADRDPMDLDRVRAEAATEERAAILGVLERYMRYLAHGHGTTGSQVLQQVVDEISRRGEVERGGSR